MSWDFLSWEGNRGPQWCAALSTASKSGLLSEGFTVLFVSCVAPSLAFDNQICYSFSLLTWRERSADCIQSSPRFCFSLLVEFPSFLMVKFTLREPHLYREHPYVQQGRPAEIRRQNRVKNWTWEERSKSERRIRMCGQKWVWKQCIWDDLFPGIQVDWEELWVGRREQWAQQ